MLINESKRKFSNAFGLLDAIKEEINTRHKSRLRIGQIKSLLFSLKEEIASLERQYAKLENGKVWHICYLDPGTAPKILQDDTVNVVLAHVNGNDTVSVQTRNGKTSTWRKEYAESFLNPLFTKGEHIWIS